MTAIVVNMLAKALFFVLLAGITPSAATAADPLPAAAEAPVSSAPPATTIPQVLVPRGTLVVVITNHGTNSYGNQTGSKLTYTLVQDVVVSGYVIAKAGDVAEGAVENSEAGRDDLFTQKAANLRISVDRVFNLVVTH